MLLLTGGVGGGLIEGSAGACVGTIPIACPVRVLKVELKPERYSSVGVGIRDSFYKNRSKCALQICVYILVPPNIKQVKMTRGLWHQRVQDSVTFV